MEKRQRLTRFPLQIRDYLHRMHYGDQVSVEDNELRYALNIAINLGFGIGLASYFSNLSAIETLAATWVVESCFQATFMVRKSLIWEDAQ